MLGWPVGLIPVVMYLFLYRETGEVLGDSLLQCVFVGVAAWGWWNWVRHRRTGHELVVRRASFSELRVLAVVGVVGLWLDAGVSSAFLALSVVGLLSWNARARRPMLAMV